MSVEKYYPNFTDEELEIGWLSDLAEASNKEKELEKIIQW